MTKLEEVTDAIHTRNEDITLDDVLQAFQNNEEAPIGIDLNGYFIDCDDEVTKIRQLDIRWTFNKPLHIQPKEVIEYLHSTLCPN